MSACSERSLAKFQYQSMEGISSALGTAAIVLGWAGKIPHAAGKAAALVGYGAGGAATMAGWAGSKYRDKYDSLEGACQQEQGVDPYKPNTPKPGPTGGGGGGGSGYGAGAMSGGYAPVSDWVWVSGYASEDKDGNGIYTYGHWEQVWRPIVLDLNGDGFDIIPRAFVDADANGVKSGMSWVGPTDGLLVYDHNQNGIGETAEWVLTSFAPGATSDLEALKAFDSNNDNYFSTADAKWGQFRVGVDANQDGVLGPGELRSLDQMGFTAIYLQEAAVDVIDRGGAELKPGAYFDFTGNVFTTSGYPVRFASVGFVETPEFTLLHQDTTATIMSLGTSRTLFWDGGALNISVASFSNGGQTGFANVFGGAHNDVLHGDGGDNILAGGEGADHLLGGDGNDLLYADDADLYWGAVSGGVGYDTLILTSAVSGTVHTLSHQVDAIVGSDFSDILSGAGDAEVMLVGGQGNDHLTGSSLGDVLHGGAGIDLLQGGAGNDVYFFEAGDGIERIEDVDGAADTAITDLSWAYVSSITANGNDIVITLLDGTALVLANGRIGQGVESVAFDDYTYTRDELNFNIDFMNGWTGWSAASPNVHRFEAVDIAII